MELSKNIKILLVEDAGVMRKMEIKTLKSLDLNNIQEAENGNAAIKILLEDSSFDLIISDWNMPEKDGFELLRWVRSNEKTKTIEDLYKLSRLSAELRNGGIVSEK